MARRKQTDEATARVRNLIALDAANIMRRLDARRGEMFALFSRLRSREPMLSTISTRYTSATFQELIHLPVLEQSVVDHFYECLDTLRWYFTYTEDMPSTAQQTFNTLHRRLEEAHRKLVATLGHPVSPDGTTVVEGEVLRRADKALP
ncbi:hypothetical protein [Archangium violaceum]|uniref:Uncharacterized protein n=1 Tax=Archangium violaceum Cb vi76 TaxID=1406225 RepID=A0A084SGK0_9BACT|nr:hypothetical protein [Archangium violaceum]KFA87585.1 hypothetical protein Q664_47080 [Archangium violaceum Cb vi76]